MDALGVRGVGLACVVNSFLRPSGLMIFLKIWFLRDKHREMFQRSISTPSIVVAMTPQNF